LYDTNLFLYGHSEKLFKELRLTFELRTDRFEKSINISPKL